MRSVLLIVSSISLSLLVGCNCEVVDCVRHSDCPQSEMCQAGVCEIAPLALDTDTDTDTDGFDTDASMTTSGSTGTLPETSTTGGSSSTGPSLGTSSSSGTIGGSGSTSGTDTDSTTGSTGDGALPIVFPPKEF